MGSGHVSSRSRCTAVVLIRPGYESGESILIHCGICVGVSCLEEPQLASFNSLLYNCILLRQSMSLTTMILPSRCTCDEIHHTLCLEANIEHLV